MVAISNCYASLSVSIGSPFVCEMEGASHILPLDNGMIRVPLGEPAVVAIDPRRMGHLVEAAIVDVIGGDLYALK